MRRKHDRATAVQARPTSARVRLFELWAARLVEVREKVWRMRKATWWEEFQRGARRPEQQHIVDLEAEVERVRAEAKDWQDLNAEHWAEYWRLRADAKGYREWVEQVEDQCAALLLQRNEARDEVERLRAAGRGLVEHLADTGEKDCPIVAEYADVITQPVNTSEERT